MKGELFYSILKYRQGLILGESLNAGILFYNPTNQKFTFELGDLKRISGAYPGLNLNFLNPFISTLKDNISRLSKPPLVQFELENLEKFVTKELFFSDVAGLGFEAVERIPISENGDYQKTIDYLKQILLVGSKDFSQEKRKRNEDYILSEVNKILKKKDPKIFDKIRRDGKIETPLIQFTFDFCWQSNETHLAKALSFDLENDVLIQNKALLIYGAVEQLKSTHLKNEASTKLDLLVTVPSEKTHFAEFDKAIKILESTSVPLTISLEKDWNRYADELVSYAEELAI